jgi:hypothetical protein
MPLDASTHWLQTVFETGRALPEMDFDGNSSGVRLLLERAFFSHSLDFGGPELPFCPKTASWAAMILHAATVGLKSNVNFPSETRRPASPAEHLSADICLRYIAPIYRRWNAARSQEPETEYLKAILLCWPLSGVTAGLREPPESELAFFGHPGLQMEYARRLPAGADLAWFPKSGPTHDYARIEFAARQQPYPGPSKQEVAT